MKQEIKDKWVQALESGNYKQGRKFLKYKGCFCAVGVLCDVVNPEGWKAVSYYYRQFVDWWIQNLKGPGGVLELAEISDSEYEKILEIFKLNDGDGRSFGEIATWIKENL